MRVGIGLDLRNPPPWRRDPASWYAWNLDLVVEAERLGVGSVWLPEHHLFEDGYLPQPMTFAAAIAARTTRIRIGAGVILAPLRGAVAIAEDSAVVDILSGGRLDLGLGAGYRIPEFDAFGVPFEDRHLLLAGRVGEIRAALADPRVTPKPLQDPLPIWLAAMSPVGARRAARLRTRLLTVGREEALAYLDAWTAAGGRPGGAAAGGPVHMLLADDPEETFRAVAPHIAYQWDTYRRYKVEGTGQPVPKPIDPDRWRKPGPRGEPPRFEVLAVDDAIRVLKDRLDGLPVTDIYLWGTVAGMPEDLAYRNVELIGTKLAPALADL